MRDISEILAEHEPSSWESPTNGAWLMSCCGLTFGEGTRPLGRDEDGGAWAMYLEHITATLAAEGYPVTAAGLAQMADPGVRLLPSESIALTVALAQVRRGEDPDPNVAGMCVLALARLAGRHDWTEEDR